MLLESKHGQWGDTSALTSPYFTLATPTELSFYYHMRMPSRNVDARLKVILLNDLAVPLVNIFEAAGHNGDDWIRAKACLPEGKYKVMFIGTQDVTYESNIGLDDIQVKAGCTDPLTIVPNGKSFLLTTCNLFNVFHHLLVAEYLPVCIIYCPLTYDPHSPIHSTAFEF